MITNNKNQYRRANRCTFFISSNATSPTEHHSQERRRSNKFEQKLVHRAAHINRTLMMCSYVCGCIHLIMQLLRDNLTLWTSDDAAGAEQDGTAVEDLES